MLSFITWTVSPVLFEIGGFALRWYGILFAVGFLLGYRIEDRILKHDKAPEQWLDSLFIYVLIATVVGARLGHCLFYDWGYFSHHPLEMFCVWRGGLASHGGAIGIIIAILIYSRKVTHKHPLWTFDRLVIPVALVGALIRLGNLMNHEIYGDETTLPWGFKFIANVGEMLKYGVEPVFTTGYHHPTQIYEALCYLVVFALLMYLYWKRNAGERQGLIFGTFFIGIFLSRFLLEFIKEVQVAKEVGMTLNIGQQLSIPFILVGVYLVIRALRRPRTSGLA